MATRYPRSEGPRACGLKIVGNIKRDFAVKALKCFECIRELE